MKPLPRPKAIRTRLLLTTVIAVGAALCVLVAGFNIVFTRQLDANATDQAKNRARAELAVVDTTNGNVTIGEAADAGASDAPIWVFAGTDTLESPRANPALNSAATRLAATDSGPVDVPGVDARLVAERVVYQNRQIGTVVAGVSLAPYEQARRTALITSIGLSMLLLGVVAATTYWILGRALRPVATMTASARLWSERELDRRFELGEPHDELTELAATLDELLDRLADALRRERLLSAEISHELRTPLARITTEAELALRRERPPNEYRGALTAIELNAGEITRIIDALLQAARNQTGSSHGSSDPTDIAQRALAGCAELAQSRHITTTITTPTPVQRIAVTAELATRILQPIVDNACRHAHTTVNLTITANRNTTVYTVTDDGPGVSEDDQHRIFQPGTRGEHPTTNPSGSGLGLPLARRLATAAGGSIEATAHPAGGTFIVTLPTDTNAPRHGSPDWAFTSNINV